MKRSRMVITHPTSSSDEVNVARLGSEGDIPLCPTDNRFRFCTLSFLYSRVRNMCMCIGICQCGTIASLTRL